MEKEHIMTLHVDVATPLPIGRVADGNLMIIPITGGSFSGPKLTGTVLPGGADWNTQLPSGKSHACARYWIQTDDGAVISVHNEGVISGSDTRTAMHTTPSFQCDADGPYAFLSEGSYEATLSSAGDSAVKVDVYRIG